MFAQSENQGSQEGVTDPQEQSNLPSDPAAPEVHAAQEFAEASPENSATEPAPAGPVDRAKHMRLIVSTLIIMVHGGRTYQITPKN